MNEHEERKVYQGRRKVERKEMKEIRKGEKRPRRLHKS